MHAETPGAAGYEAEAPTLITRYESLTFEHVHRGARFERESSMPVADVLWSVLALRRP